MSEPTKFYGLGVLRLPVGVVAAATLEQQIDVLWDIADDDSKPREERERALRTLINMEQR